MEENERREGVLKQHFALYVKKPSMKDCFVTVFIFMICTIIGLLFQKLHFTDTNIVTIYILGVLITSILTDGYLCSIAGSFLSVVLFCFFLLSFHKKTDTCNNKNSRCSDQYRPYRQWTDACADQFQSLVKCVYTEN